MFDKVKYLWALIDGLNSSLKTLIIISLLFLIIPRYIDFKLDTFKSKYTDCYEQYRVMAEKYALSTAPIISREVEGILEADNEIKNVILVNYHNTKSNLNGYSYLYLSSLTEATRDKEWRSEWKDLDYVYYSNEITRIHNRKYLRIDSIYKMAEEFPKLRKKVEFCEASSVAFYPLDGVSNPIGMIIVLYDKPKRYQLGYYQTIIAPHVERLTALLDYSNITDKFIK